MNHDLRGSAAHVLVDDITAPTLSRSDVHHLATVLRLRGDELVTVTDGCGRWRRCRWHLGGVLEVDGDVVHDTVRAQSLTVACAIPKGDRPEWVVEKLAEIGVDRVVWVETARSVVRWNSDRAARNRQRLAKVAASALSQSRRTRLMGIEGPIPLAAVRDQPGVVVADPDGRRELPAGTHTIVVGPEGGFDPSELGERVVRVALSDAVLRVETAAILAGYLLIRP